MLQLAVSLGVLSAKMSGMWVLCPGREWAPETPSAWNLACVSFSAVGSALGPAVPQGAPGGDFWHLLVSENLGNKAVGCSLQGGGACRGESGPLSVWVASGLIPHALPCWDLVGVRVPSPAPTLCPWHPRCHCAQGLVAWA